MATETAEKNKVKISNCRSYVKDLLDSKLPDHIHFHDWSHTKMVAKETEKIAKEADCSKDEIEILILAALFHDTGFTETYDGHEAVSIRIAEDYLGQHEYPAERIEKIRRLIEVTDINKEPKTKLEKILVDGDMSHLGKKKYNSRVDDLRRERAKVTTNKIVSLEWAEANISFMKEHYFYTDVAKERYGKRKSKNLKKLRKRKQSLEEDATISNNKAARMIFKTALRNHIDLTNIADQKANIMLSINALVLTLGMPLFATHFQGQPQLMIPGVFFLFTAIATMIIATLATRPIKTTGKTDLRKLLSGKSNLFFFGNFYRLQLEEYHDSISRVLSDQESLDKSIINDLYHLGESLGSKYKRLRWCYTFFAGGLFATFIAFLISYYIYA
jgi:predicted metal-dependent HD superfamily phosphohydrolase